MDLTATWGPRAIPNGFGGVQQIVELFSDVVSADTQGFISTSTVAADTLELDGVFYSIYLTGVNFSYVGDELVSGQSLRLLSMTGCQTHPVNWCLKSPGP